VNAPPPPAGTAGRDDETPETPTLRVLRGHPNAEELACLLAVVAATRQGEADGADGNAPRPALAWADHRRRHRGGSTPARSEHGWRTSYWAR